MECYVCLEENCYTLSPCKCTNLYVHPHCYIQVVQNFKECGICKEPFYDQFIKYEFQEEGEEEEEPNYPDCLKTYMKISVSYILIYLAISFSYDQQLTLTGLKIFLATIAFFICMIIFGKHI